MKFIKRGEIWLINLESTIGHEIKKSRPAVIIQNNIGNKYSPITIVAPITPEKIDNVYPVEVLLTKKTEGLIQDSKVLLNQIRAVDKQCLIKKIGYIDEITMEKIDEAIKISLGLVKI